MDTESNYIETNRRAWNEKTGVHIKSAFYDNETFLKGKSSLRDVELNLLGDIAGKNILHLQCHFGQDSISLSRLGANVTAIDLSDEAIKEPGNLLRKPILQPGLSVVIFMIYQTIWMSNLILYLQVMERFPGCPTLINGLKSFQDI